MAKGTNRKPVAQIHTALLLEPVVIAIVSFPLTYPYAFVNQWVWSTVFSRKLVFTSGLSNPSVLLHTLAEESNSMFFMVGSQVALFRRIIKDGAVFPRGTSTKFC